MPEFPRLTRRQDPIVKDFRDLAGDAADGERVLLDGAHLVGDALDAGVRLRTLLVTSRFFDRATSRERQLPDRAAAAGALVFSVTEPVMDAASPVRTSSGIVAIADWQCAQVTAVLAASPALVIGLVDVQDPGNVGAAIRSADALGASGLLALGASAHPAGWKAMRASMGSAFRLPIGRGDTLRAIRDAHDRGLRVFATAVDAAQPVSTADLRGPALLLVGNEGAGLSPDAAALADEAIAIPMRGRANSLNVSVSVGLLLYEAMRQRFRS
jgi:TrmH family RNA methyltransferase